MRSTKLFIVLLLFSIFLAAPAAYAMEQSGAGTGGEVAHGAGPIVFLWIALLLLLAKISGLIEKFGQPSVLGELVMGVILGNLALAGIHFFEPIKADPIINFLAEFGVVILLFQIGLESDIHKMQKVGVRALLVAAIGVVAPFVLGTYIVGPWLMPGLSMTTYLFLGAALTATSVGITARVFRDLGKLRTPEARIVLGAAVIDDVLGLIILAVVSALAVGTAVSVGLVGGIVAKAIGFLLGAIVLGQMFAPQISRLFSKISTGTGMKFTIAVSFGLIFAYLAHAIGLAPIVGAFAAGLVLDPVHFRFFRNPTIVRRLRKVMKGAEPATRDRISRVLTSYSRHHVEDLLEPLSYLLVPLFFLVTGMQVDLTTLFNPSVLLVALGITAVALVGKVAAGLAAGNVRKWIVGWGMVPRGEVGLIFATIGKGLGVIPDEVFSVIIIMVILTTLLPPPILTYLLKRS